MFFPRDASGNLDFKRLGIYLLLVPIDLVTCAFLMAASVYLLAPTIAVALLLCFVEIVLLAFLHKKAYDRWFIEPPSV